MHLYLMPLKRVQFEICEVFELYLCRASGTNQMLQLKSSMLMIKSKKLQDTYLISAGIR